MRSEKAWYWLAAGVLALGLNGAYQDGQLGWAHCLADRATGLVERVSERALRFVTVAEVMLGRNAEGFGRTEAALQKVQTKVVCDRVARAQRQMAMAQAREQLAEAKLQRKMNLVQLKMDKVRMVTIDRTNRFRNCPGFPKITVGLAEMPKIDLSDMPDIQISDLPDFDQGPAPESNGPI